MFDILDRFIGIFNDGIIDSFICIRDSNKRMDYLAFPLSKCIGESIHGFVE